MNYYTDVLKKYAVFDGRARRKEYWMFLLWNILIALGLAIVFGLIGSAIGHPGLFGVYYLYDLAVFLPGLAVIVRRLHDTGRSGWWIWLNLIPLIGAIIVIVFLAQDSQPGDNKYGPNPKGIAAAPAGVVQ